MVFDLVAVNVIMERAKNFCYINRKDFVRKVSFPLNRYERLPAIEVYQKYMLENESFLQLMKVISDIKESDLSVSGFDYEEFNRCLN